MFSDGEGNTAFAQFMKQNFLRYKYVLANASQLWYIVVHKDIYIYMDMLCRGKKS
jgi:hypothetical protein